jgi:hypothetical protein
MGIAKNCSTALHSIKVRLHKNYLPGMDGTYNARTANEATLDIAKICESMKDRGNYAGKYEEMIGNVKNFLDEAAYLLCDGFALNLGYFSIHPNIGGTFGSVHEKHDSKKHPITIRYRTHSKFREMLENISVVVIGEAKNDSLIKAFFDHDKASASQYEPGHLFSIIGKKIKLAGDDPGCGVYFVPIDHPEAAVKVSRIYENSRKKIIGVAPDTGHHFNTIEVRTQFCGSPKVFLKTPIIIRTEFVIEAAA